MTEAFDVTDAMKIAITFSLVVMRLRIAPRNDDEVNEEWISNKARFVVDGLKRQRLDRPYVRKNGKLEAVTGKMLLLLLLKSF